VLDLQQLSDLIDKRHTFDLLRVQTLDRYTVASDGEDYQRYLRGEAEPDAARKQPWLDHLRSLVESGRRWRNVHVLTTPLTPYLQYAAEWGYRYNVAAGQDVRIVELVADDLLGNLAAVGDFWVIDHELVVRMEYDGGGRFVGAEVIPGPRDAALYRSVADLLWRQSEPFTSWWNTHPQYHRGTRAA
jgi:hypothetical protein